MIPEATLKNKKTTLPGPWRASRKRSGSAPGQQAAERYLQTISFKYMCVAVCSCVINCIHIHFNAVCLYTFNILVIHVCKSVFVHLYVTYRGIYIFIYIHTPTKQTHTLCVYSTHTMLVISSSLFADCSWFMARLPIDPITPGSLSVLH